MYVTRTQDEIEDVRDRCWKSKDSVGTKFPGMSYEEGVLAALEWIVGDRDEAPMED